MNRAFVVSKVLMWQGLCFFSLQLNYSHNDVLVAPALKQMQSNNGDVIYLTELMTMDDCGGASSLVRRLSKYIFSGITLIQGAFKMLKYLCR